VKGPVCQEDVRHGKLCRICEAKLKAGQISTIDFELLKAIEKLGNKRFLVATEIMRAFELGDTVLVFASGNVGALIGRDGKNIKELEKALGKRVRVIEPSKAPKETIQQVIGRASILAVNRVFKPDGEELRVIVDSKDKQKIGAGMEQIEAVLKAMLKVPVEITFS
jgi:transcription antitermination factor NusA-like protein